ncbi:ATP-binding protein [Archangium violaceum]|uniref:ATP-binding protein n=1 Tax=Archangium violaceum TaxID=83451 RepID=UPI002B2DD2EA|nr:ATP-binding protein [Archangium gephyra]
MPPSSKTRAPLARSTLIHIGVRIAVVIALTTLFSYLHMFRVLRTVALSQLENYVSERGQREEAIFVLAEDNHAILKKALEERLEALREEDVTDRFERLFAELPDGTIRNRPEGFDGTRMIGLFSPRGVNVNADVRRKIMAAYDVLLLYALAFHVRFTNTFITLPEGPIISYWPEQPTYSQQAPPTESIISQDFFVIALPEKDPERKTVWTGVYFEPVTRLLMTTVSTPLDMGGRHVATISHDVLLAELVNRTSVDHLPGAYNVLFRDDGELIAHPELKAGPEGQPARPSAEQQAHVQAIFERVKTRQPGQAPLEVPEHSEYLAVARIRGPGWYFVTVLPESVVTAPAFQAARFILLLGILSLILELVIMAWVLKQKITRPLGTFTQAADRISAGDFHVELDTGRKDELGQLAHSFRLMADEVQRREVALRQANEGLEQRVEERTRELKEVHLELVQTARRAGMAEIATNVLHNVGNVLNSVYTSAQLAKEQMASLRLEQVGRVAHLLQARKSDVGTFLTQDERGRNVLPFLSKLGENLEEERQVIAMLLDDVGRYTEHIRDIVMVQQDYARIPQLHEPVRVAELVEDALRINATGLTRHQVKVQRHLAELPPVLTDKHKLLMILVNLVSNAKYALDGVAPAERLLTLKLEHTDSDQVLIVVHDNGMGIAPEMLTRIFQYGFTTREEGHGFGLHSSALAAQELGGSLTAHSQGPGQGATFTLEFPFSTAEEAA